MLSETFLNYERSTFVETVLGGGARLNNLNGISRTATGSNALTCLKCRDKSQGIKITYCRAKFHSKAGNRVYHH